MTRWKLAIIVGAATAIGVTGVALALDGDGRGDGDRAARAAVVAERNDNDGGPREWGSGSQAPEGSQAPDGRQAPDLDQLGALQELMQDPEFRDDLWALKDGATTAVKKWWDKYGDDPTSAKAREALGELRDEQRAKFEALLEEYGVSADDLGRMGGGMFGGGMFGAPPGGDQDGPSVPGDRAAPQGDATGAGSATSQTL
jgi:hypothetical protein